MAQKYRKKVAVVQCNGGTRAESTISRETITGDCKQRKEQYPEGVLQCKWGCLGGGTCVDVCKFGAISINDNEVAEVDRDKCIGCGLCAKVCPNGVIKITSREFNIYPACRNQEVGAQTRKECKVGCIACGICAKNCPADAITIEENCAVIHEERCIACGMCAVKCPRGTIVDADGIFTVRA